MYAKGYPALLGQPWLVLVKGSHDWETSQIRIGPPDKRITLQLDGTKKPALANGGMEVEGAVSADEEYDSDSELEDDSDEEDSSDGAY